MLQRLRRALQGGEPSTSATPASDNRGDVSLRAAMFDRSSNVVNVVGESHRQGALERIGGGSHGDGVRRPDHIAGVILEPDNPVDPNAVAVEIDANLVGYLDRPNALAYRPVLDRLAAHGLRMACHARLVGGWDRAGSKGSIGVRLMIGTPANLWRELDAMLGAAAVAMPTAAVTRPVRPTPVPMAAQSGGGHAWVGKSVCFTGASRYSFRGESISRAMQELLAAQHGLVVVAGVTKALDLLVMADLTLRTGKAVKAEAYGTAVLDESAFWTTLGVVLDPIEGDGPPPT